jgi:16S rRNA (adenine1518-N6/adenine1519-N6)-dimethyltransferase
MKKNIFPKKSLGQNFLIDKNIINKIINLIDFKQFNTIVEIGPGQGAITNSLYKKSKRLILIEIDKELIDNLKENFPGTEIYNVNFLKWNHKNIGSNVLAIGNLPYNVSTQIIFNILANHSVYKQAIFMLQKEVAQRVVADNSNKNYSIISAISQSFSNPEINFHISSNCFYPKPKVISTIVKFNIRNKYNIENFDDFFLFIKAFFYGKRKKLINVLSTNPFISFQKNFLDYFKNNFSANTRINNLSVEQIVNLYKIYKN